MTESDIELLRLAAKAAGHEIEFTPEDTGFEFVCFEGSNRESWAFWDPLKKDGDALRLAVSLHMQVDCYDRSARPHPEAFTWIDGNRSDAGEATRRAIVSAAAEVGKAMP